MEQSTVTEFFPAVKNHRASFSSHPAKRRKVAESALDMQPMKQARATRVRTAGSKTTRESRKKKANAISLSQLFSATPVTSTSETTLDVDQHKELKRKAPSKSLQAKQDRRAAKCMPSKIPVPVKATPDFLEVSEPRGSIKVDPWISEQAKLVMSLGRGSAAVQAAKGKQSATQKSLKASDVFRPSNSEANAAAKGNVREECLKKFKESVQQEGKTRERGKLRNKFAHLVNDGAATSRTEKISEPPKTAKTDSLSRSTVSSSTSKVPRQLAKHKKKFTEKHLAQMKTVYPNGFTFRIEKNLRDLNGMPSGPQLTIEANFEDVMSSKHVDKKDTSQTVLITRRNLFETALIDITKKHHQKYLHKLNLKIAASELQRWHPHFKLEDVPEIQETNLPQVTVTKSVTSAKDILDRNHCIPQVEKALQNVSKSSEKKESSKPNPATISSTQADTKQPYETKSTTQNNGILKGVSSTLLDRIREKEQKKAALAMLRNPEQEKRLGSMEQLPSFVRILKTYFTTEKKAAITLEDCVGKLLGSFSSAMSSANVEEHVRLLNELVPDWLSIVNVRKCQYVKLTKNSDINVVIRKLESIKDKESKR
eukprot:Seg3325.5 transcript_id=Seg3325.5/GoldUCD/mRNA.D3Y31 product="DNA replication factor Cdt1" protein_id=Seg3325.5/GoldUCD/D3Y31